MAEGKVSGCFNLRIKCFVIGYMNLVACVVDIVFHVLIAAIVSNGFQCDIDINSLNAVKWPWLEPLLLVLNLGTHGFYAFPMTLRSNGHYADHMPVPSNPTCYPGMVHVYLIDILILLINIIWMKFVLAFITSIYKKDLSSMRMFFHLALVKLVLQLIYFAYEPTIQATFSLETFWLMKLIDSGLAAYFLFVINSYINALRREMMSNNAELPPPYVENLIETHKTQIIVQDVKKEDLDNIAVICDKKNMTDEVKN